MTRVLQSFLHNKILKKLQPPIIYLFDHLCGYAVTQLTQQTIRASLSEDISIFKKNEMKKTKNILKH